MALRMSATSGELQMSSEQTITHDIAGAKLTVQVDALVSAWLEQQVHRSRNLKMLGELVIGESVLGRIASPPRIGAVWPGEGGINGGVARDESGNPYWLIVSPGDISTQEFEWGGRGHEEPGAKSEFDGRANTLALRESSVDHPAACRCSEVVYEGHRDFYLPAKRESAVLYASVPEMFEKAWYWTSTQYSAYLAWYQYFDGGYQDLAYKDGTGRVRAVRRLDF
jgi:hypothetical protein